ncbi:triple tyrosine motif-containing protein [Winogradskyella sp. A3E31]|uniref:triple tyrosine motif-containing protein n=1 Tax=Winogradskyella sp. A3E31 TaxID=3349637 RepID=UPI00398AF7E9
MRHNFCISLFLCFWTLLGFTQELPPIVIFSPQDYNAEDQNWSISQSDDKTIYVANNEGLLQFNGAKWNLYKTPNNTILRSIEVINDRIYTGSYMDFGYWIKNAKGTLTYTSLTSRLEDKLIEDEEFWDITELEGRVIFQSLDRIFIYNESEEFFRVIDSKSRIIKMYIVDNNIYFQKINGSIFKIDKGSEQLLIDGNDIGANEVANIFSIEDGLLIQTREKGFYKLKGSILSKWNINADSVLLNSSVYNSIRLKDGTFLLGTISKGIIQLNDKGDIIFKLDQSNGLGNNTVLSLFEDESGNVWLGLDNGISVINFNSPFNFYKDSEGVLGTIYASARHNGNIYLGTNQGLFYKKESSEENFQFVTSTKGQVWGLDKIGDTLFCGHDKGTFVIDGRDAIQISTERGAWGIKAIPNNPNLLIQGNYQGLFIFQNNNGKWSLRNKLKGFDISSRYFEFVTPTKLLVSHEYKGVYKLILDNDLNEVLEYKKLDQEIGKGTSLIKYNDAIYYSYNDGVFKYNESETVFQRDSILSTIFKDATYVSGRLIYDSNANRLWGFTENHIVYVEAESLTGDIKIHKISLPDQERKFKVGFENILYLNKSEYLLGTTEGYMVIDLQKIKKEDYMVTLNSVAYSPLYGDGRLLQLNSEETNLKNKENTLKFTYSIVGFSKYAPPKYQYRLAGMYNEWSEWSINSETIFENLPHGNFVFEVRAKVGNHLSENTATYSFNIKRPWYLTTVAILGYCMLFVVITLGIQVITRAYYKNQKERALAIKERELEYKELENQKQLVEFRNKSLRQDIENKNRELGISTMNLIKKNEFLSGIKNELKDVKQVKDVKSVIKVIDRNINNKDDWKFFEKAFNNADKDFLKKVKNIHPELTPNDLKLCAYLRLNLASKEIAPLLNISPRSVEVKRYRLRKKMNLPHEASLTNYILDI